MILELNKIYRCLILKNEALLWWLSLLSITETNKLIRTLFANSNTTGQNLKTKQIKCAMKKIHWFKKKMVYLTFQTLNVF